MSDLNKYNAPQGAPPSYPQQSHDPHANAGYYGSPPPQNQGPYGAPAQYGQPGQMQYQQGYPPQGYPPQQYQQYPQQGYPPQQGYHGDQRGPGGSSGGGICAGLLGACACCLCLDFLF